MKCIVCGKDYDAPACPRCHFPNVQIVGDRAAFFAQMQPTIDAFRNTFLEKVEVSLLIYYWKDQDGNLVPDREESLLLGTAAALQEHDCWLSRQFARIPDTKSISVTVQVTVPDSSPRHISVRVPNLQQPLLQQIGARLDEKMNLQLLLRNEAQQGAGSTPVCLLPA